MKLVLYTNMLTPYRKYTYDLIYQTCFEQGDEFSVLLMAETEGNRIWKYEEFKTPYTTLLQGKTLNIKGTYIHVNLGLREKLKELKPDIVVCAGSYLCPGTWEIVEMKKKLGFKCFFWSESHLDEHREYNKLKIKIRDLIRKRFYRMYDGFWYAGKLSREFIETYAQKDVMYFLMPNLIDDQKFKAAGEIVASEKIEKRRHLGILDDEIVFLCPARLSPVKGILEFMDVLEVLDNKDKVLILIAGAGELKEKIEKRAFEKKLHVRLLGFQCQEEMLMLYGLADVFLLPSLSDPNPLSCIEALWAGLPLFISKHCGNYPEVIQNGVNGYVFDYGNKSKMLQDLDNIICNKTWRKNASEKSKVMAITRYASKTCVERLIGEIHMKGIKGDGI